MRIPGSYERCEAFHKKKSQIRQFNAAKHGWGGFYSIETTGNTTKQTV